MPARWWVTKDCDSWRRWRGGARLHRVRTNASHPEESGKAAGNASVEQITQQGLQVAEDIGRRHGFSAAAVAQLMQAMQRSGGGMAQFNHPELGGNGQWMAGGMMMIGEMFNNALKARVDGLCQEVAAVLRSQPMTAAAMSPSLQQQSGGGWQQQSSVAPASAATVAPEAEARMTPPAGALFAADPRDHWWPVELGSPSARGEQNTMRYAVFPAAGRLAVEVNGQVNVYDIGRQQIGGLSQQQGGAVVVSTAQGGVSLSSFSAVGAGSQQQQSGGGWQQQSSGGGTHQQSSGGGFQQQSSSGSSVSLADGSSAGSSPSAPWGMAAMTSMTPMTPMAPMTASQPWWPEALGTPASSGAQNDLRHALFPSQKRLAVMQGDHCRLFDAGDLQILAVAVDSGSGELMVITAEGERPLSQLTELTENGPTADQEPQQGQPPGAAGSEAPDDPFAALERLGELKSKGILTEEEFSLKKKELLGRL
jgi:hypothetical protein